MKHKILLSAITILFLSMTSTAQVTKGSFYIGGTAGYSGSNGGTENAIDKYRTVYINPSIGRVVKDDLVMGVELNYYHYKYNTVYDDRKYSRKEYGGGLFLRKYFPVVKRLYIFAHGNIEGDAIREKTTSKSSGTETGKGWSARMNVYPGLSFAINKKLHIESGLSNLLSTYYTKVNFTSTMGEPKKSENFGAGISAEGYGAFFIGVRFLLPG